MRREAKKSRCAAWAALVSLAALLAVLIYLRRPAAETAAPSAPEIVPPTSVCETTPRDEPVPTPIPSETPEPAAPTPVPTPDLSQYRPIVYDARSYELVTDMVFAYRRQMPNRDSIIAADVEALTARDERLGAAWGGIMAYWDYANTRMEINFDELPEDLPGDDSLCIVVLGFQLAPDGGMAPELLGRCELALRAAEQYPNAFLFCTGGGTAREHPEITEAGAMADWFLAQGLPAGRLIVEDRSTTTEENAMNALRILTEQYPQVHSLVIVTSDYHLPLSCLLFTETALLYECEYGYAPYAVVSNLGLRGYGLNEYKNPEEQALYVWNVARPQPNA